MTGASEPARREAACTAPALGGQGRPEAARDEPARDEPARDEPARRGDAEALETKLRRLRGGLAALGSVVVAFSGGADSALLAYLAHDTLGRDRAMVVTAVSDSLAPEEAAGCAELAAAWGLDWRPVETDELTDAAYVANDAQRCAHCKSSLMAALEPLRGAGATIVLGVNVDDLGDHRPGQQAAADRGAVFPFVDAGLTKRDVRDISRRLGLRTWNKPAAACLASRLPYGTPVTVGRLRSVAAAESALRALGLGDPPANPDGCAGLRVRHYGDTARVEVALAEFDAVLSRRREVVAAVRAAGFTYVTLDLEGLRSGNLNDALGPLAPAQDGRPGTAEQPGFAART